MKKLSLLLLVAGCQPGSISGSDELQPGLQPDVVVHSVRPSGTGSPGEYTMASVAAPPRVLFLNRAGGTYTAGWDDSAHGVSSVVQSQGKTSVTIAAAPWDDKTWKSFVACVADEYARWNIQITDVRPSSGAYIEGVIGGTGAELGFGQGIGGVAPLDSYSCQPLPTAIGFIFAGNSWAVNDPQQVCEIAAHELGHSIVPLDHEYLAADPMTYLTFNGHKTFQDADAKCGEYQTRDCICKRPTQNTVQLLNATLGPAQPTAPPPSPPPAADSTPPVVTILSPGDGATLPANGNITVTVEASDADDAVASVSLYWAFSKSTLPCDGSVQGVTCTHNGNRYAWTFAVGSGDRQLYATATDSHGNAAQSALAHVTLGSAAPPPPAGAPPEVAVSSPAEGGVIHPGGALDVAVQVHDDGTITDVTMHWTNGASTTDFALHESTTGVYAFTSTLSAAAAAGARSFTITATDDAGNKTTTPPVHLMVQ